MANGKPRRARYIAVGAAFAIRLKG